MDNMLYIQIDCGNECLICVFAYEIIEQLEQRSHPFSSNSVELVQSCHSLPPKSIMTETSVVFSKCPHY